MGLSLENVCYSINEKIIFDNINLKISKPGLYAICGENGCGKTTLIEILMNQRKNITGALYINDKLIYNDGNGEDANHYFTYIKASEELIEGLTLRGYFKILSLNIDKYTNELEIFNIKNILDERISRLSKGERTRIYLLLNVLTSKNVILMDEATANLDENTEEKIFEYLKALANEKIIIYASNTNKCLSYADYVIKISKELSFTNEDELILKKRKKYSFKLLGIIKCKKYLLFLLFSAICIFLLGFAITYKKSYSKDNVYETMLNEGMNKGYGFVKSSYYSLNDQTKIYDISYQNDDNNLYIQKEKYPFLKDIIKVSTMLYQYVLINDDINDNEIYININLSETYKKYNEILELNFKIKDIYEWDNNYVILNKRTYYKSLFKMYEHQFSFDKFCVRNENGIFTYLDDNGFTRNLDIIPTDIDTDLVLPTALKDSNILFLQNNDLRYDISKLNIKYSDEGVGYMSEELFYKIIDTDIFYVANEVELGVYVNDINCNDIKSFLNEYDLFINLKNQRDYSFLYLNSTHNLKTYIFIIVVAVVLCYSSLIIGIISLYRNNKMNIAIMRSYNFSKVVISLKLGLLVTFSSAFMHTLCIYLFTVFYNKYLNNKFVYNDVTISCVDVSNIWYLLVVSFVIVIVSYLCVFLKWIIAGNKK